MSERQREWFSSQLHWVSLRPGAQSPHVSALGAAGTQLLRPLPTAWHAARQQGAGLEADVGLDRRHLVQDARLLGTVTALVVILIYCI